MPDGTTFSTCAYLDLPETLPRGHDGLRALAKALRQQQAWENKFSWDFKHFINNDVYSSCGFAGCAIGLAEYIWKLGFVDMDDEGEVYRSVIRKHFNLSSGEIYRIFEHGAASTLTITPLAVARRIEEFIEAEENHA